MTKLTGTEKQVAWAEDIRKRYIKTAETLKEIIAIYSDNTQKEIVDHDPLFGDEVSTVYVSQTNGTTHMAAIVSARHWGPADSKKAKDLSWKMDRAAELKAAGEKHSERKAQVEYISATLVSLEKAIAEETSASYWIDRR